MLWLLDIVMMVLSAIVLDKQEQEALQAVGMQLQQISANRNYELLSSRKARSLKKATSPGQMLTLAAQKTATRGEPPHLMLATCTHIFNSRFHSGSVHPVHKLLVQKTSSSSSSACMLASSNIINIL